jgi:FAD/FMN-containing dehydrogenase
MTQFLSWGRYPYQPQIPHYANWPEDITQLLLTNNLNESSSTLAFGCGRSYGDSCLAASGHVIATQKMDRVISVNWDTGVIFAQAGLTLDEVISIALPRGWFLPVTPGTKFVTLGGAVANDVHGKNHHVMGTFGCHVKSFLLSRTDEGVVNCSPSENLSLFAATLGGLGLTGLILAVEIQLRRVSSSKIEQRSIKFGGLDEFFAISQAHDAANEYSVAWIDCLAKGQQAGRGHYILGNHALDDDVIKVENNSSFRIPIEPPFSLINAFSLKVFNTLYYHRQLRKEVTGLVGYNPFFYPLDRLQQWNRIYGKSGFQQYQCVIPQLYAREVVRDILQQISKSNTGSFLAVLKQCGEIESPGVISFPLHGISLALDFPQHHQINKRLFEKLDDLVHEAGGRLYPAKDAHMNAIHFKQAYPQWEELETLRDTQLLSSFWKRVTQ